MLWRLQRLKSKRARLVRASKFPRSVLRRARRRARRRRLFKFCVAFDEL